MDFIYQKYTRGLFFVKAPGFPQSPVKKALLALSARKIKAWKTSVHLMDKTDILFENSERNHFSLPFD